MARMIHIGKKVPKGFRELAGACHIGKGIWILPMDPDPLFVKPRKKPRGAAQP